MSRAKLNEPEIKALVLEKLRSDGVIMIESIVASEFVLGSTGRRADLAIWNGELVGIEIKSKFDSLARLSAQLDVYTRCFDRVILVVDEKHRDKAVLNLPACVELWSVDSFGTILLVRPPSAKQEKDARTLAQLCTVPQLKSLTMATKRGRLSRKALLASAEELPIQLIENAVAQNFRNQFRDSSSEFWHEIADQEVSARFLAGLSRFSGVREKFKERSAAERFFWNDWTARASQVFAD